MADCPLELPLLPEDIVWMPLEEALQTLIDNKLRADGVYFACQSKHKRLRRYIETTNP